MLYGLKLSLMATLFIGQTCCDTLPTLSLSVDSSYSAYYSSSAESSSSYSSSSSSSSSSFPASFSFSNATPNLRFSPHPVPPHSSSSSSSSSSKSSLPSLSSSPMQLAVRIHPKPQPRQMENGRRYRVMTDDDEDYDDDDEDDDYYIDDYDDYYDDGEGNGTTSLESLKPRGPYFASDNSSTSVFLGSTATLECTVLDLTNESVSWLRQVDDLLKLLTWGSHTYTTDERYSLVQEIGDKWQRWQLVIRDAQLEDQGQYRCQVATQPSMIMAMTLNIIEPVVRLVDERGTDIVDKHYNSGSMIELKCIIEKVPFPHAPVTWRRGTTLLTFNTSRGGISVKGSKASGYIRSRLYVANASPTDSGVYSCWYGNYTSDNVTVHVIAGENSQAMQHDALPETPTSSGTFTTRPICSSCLCLLLLNCFLPAFSFVAALSNALSAHWRLCFKISRGSSQAFVDSVKSLNSWFEWRFEPRLLLASEASSLSPDKLLVFKLLDHCSRPVSLFQRNPDQQRVVRTLHAFHTR